MKVAIVGSRSISQMNMQDIRKHIPAECTEIISGGAMGVDTLAEQYAALYAINFVKIEPNYNLFGKQAPLIRNTQIVQRADRVLAFWNNKSRGTAHTISECIRLSVPIQIITVTNE